MGAGNERREGEDDGKEEWRAGVMGGLYDPIRGSQFIKHFSLISILSRPVWTRGMLEQHHVIQYGEAYISIHT